MSDWLGRYFSHTSLWRSLKYVQSVGIRIAGFLQEIRVRILLYLSASAKTAEQLVHKVKNLAYLFAYSLALQVNPVLKTVQCVI